LSNIKETNSTKLNVDIKILVILILISLFILLVPFFLRYYYLNGYLMGSESYLNVRLAMVVAGEDQIPNYDYLSYGGRGFSYNLGWPIVLSIIYSIIPINIHLISGFLSIFFGLLSILMLYLILYKLKFSKLQRILIVFILILSPAFIYASNLSSSVIVTIALSFISFYLMNSNKKINHALSLLILFLIPLFSFVFGLFVLFILVLYILIIDRSKLKFLIIAILVMSVSYIYYLFLFGVPEPINFKANDNSIINYFSELGANFGLSFFAVVLSLFGLNSLKSEKNVKIFIYILFFISIILASLYLEILFYFSIMIAIFAGIGLTNLFHDKWESEIIRKTTIFILVVGIAFFGISYIGRTINLEPNVFLVEGIGFLENNVDSKDTVAAHYKLGHYITYAGIRNIMDSYFIYAPKLNKRYVDMNEFFYAQDINAANKFIKDYSVDYIMFDDYTYNLLYKNKLRNTYLPYYLNNDKRFRIVFENEGVTIWKVFQ